MESTNDNEPWELEDYYLLKDSHRDMSHCLWDEINPNEEDLSYMFDETTPIKACGDLAYHVTESEQTMNKEIEEYSGPSLQVKRRRMLEFNAHAINPCHENNERISSAFVKSKIREDSIEAALPETLEWGLGFSEDKSAYSNEGLVQSSEGWLANGFNDAEMNFNPDYISTSGFPNNVVDISEFCDIPSTVEADVLLGCDTPNPQSVFKGRKSYMRTPTKLASSIAYPFTVIKPCEVHGDVTLKDINQRIRTPPSSKSIHSKDEFSTSYPTSAFSGKPVVFKTKISTEGGKGSITIMKTKG